METYHHTKSYVKAYLSDSDFESVLVQFRQKMVLEFLKEYRPQTVLELGCGPDLLLPRVIGADLGVKHWVMVEPCQEFARKALKTYGQRKPIKLDVIQGFLEKSINSIQAIHPKPFDIIICSGMLNEIRHPDYFLNKVKALMDQKSLLHINVPNANSLHRQLGLAMGMIRRLDEPSVRNRKLMQYHVFDKESLHRIVKKCHLKIVDEGGHFLKPFSHSQMAKMKSVLTPQMLEGLWILGQRLPEIATEIYVNVKRS